ncbi:MAG: SUMF1/EgtB/PvdO family nonheme iron enzyme [Candidatus Eremiobacteraeota bacterium]|nr:SUMF1/EgtB/PvdO family nonheme iron enzyme [Candidatus Eremiobacteraeota bacterium]
MDTLKTRTARPALDRAELRDAYLQNRARSAQVFGLVDPRVYYARPIPLRHPFAFYEGHLPAFSFLTLNERALAEKPIDARLEKLFERGIDPSDAAAAAKAARVDWPTAEQVAAFSNACDARVLDAIAHATLDDPSNARLERAQSAHTIIEHEQMHHETLLYIINQLEYADKGRIAQSHHDAPRVRNPALAIPAGVATLGVDPDRIVFGWDNEFDESSVDVPAFSIDTFPVTNGDYLDFVAAGADAPPFWIRRDDQWYLRGIFEELPLPKSWPVYAGHDQAQAYANWKDARLPTEAQYQRAAYGSPTGEERKFPWGEQPPGAVHGNFDFHRFDPEPVDAHPAGASAWGVYDLIGNGWEWTSTPFGPLPGFEPMASYPQYSADFFDGKHYVMKGASPVTNRQMIRRSFRNWFYADYLYMYAKFRCVYENP